LHGWGHAAIMDALATNKAHRITSACMTCGIITAFLSAIKNKIKI